MLANPLAMRRGWAVSAGRARTPALDGARARIRSRTPHPLFPEPSSTLVLLVNLEYYGRLEVAPMTNPRNYEDLTGERFGDLIVVEKTGERANRAVLWACRCRCGKIVVTDTWKLRRFKHLCRHGVLSSRSPEYRVWERMLERCRNPRRRGYANYGGRGVKVCERWLEFTNFIEDMGRRPSKAHSLERIDVDGDYEPGNCRWATAREQARNRRDTVWVDLGGGRKRKLIELVEQLGLKREVVYGRLKMGWSLGRAISAPVRVYSGKTQPASK